MSLFDAKHTTTELKVFATVNTDFQVYNLRMCDCTNTVYDSDSHLQWLPTVTLVQAELCLSVMLCSRISLVMLSACVLKSIQSWVEGGVAKQHFVCVVIKGPSFFFF